MPSPRFVVATTLLCASAIAQSGNPFIVFPQDPQRQTVTSASFVRRPSNNLAAEAFQEISPAWFRGVGDVGGSCVVDGFYHWGADEDGTTPETYGIILRGSVGGAIDPTTAGEILRISGLTTPTGTGRIGFTLTDAFATPVNVPCDQAWFQGLDLPASPNWPTTDGGSIWCADVPSISTATVGENPRLGAQNVTWSLPSGSGPVTTAWTYIMGATSAAPMLHLGGIDPTSTRTGGAAGAPSYGMAGLFPDISGAPRSDGLLVRIQDTNNPSGIAIAAIALGYFVQPLPIPPFAGELLLDIGTVSTLGFAVMTGGAGEIPVASPGVIPPVMIGSTFPFQGIVVDPATGGGSFTNTQSVVF